MNWDFLFSFSITIAISYNLSCYCIIISTGLLWPRFGPPKPKLPCKMRACKGNRVRFPDEGHHCDWALGASPFHQPGYLAIFAFRVL